MKKLPHPYIVAEYTMQIINSQLINLLKFTKLLFYITEK